MSQILKDRHIFIVEDNLENRVVFQISLIRHGAWVEFERWGRDTVQRLNGATGIDLIVLDLMLPMGVSGFTVFDEISKLPNLEGVPIVAVSAMDPAIAIPETRERGFDGFIAKPIDTQLFPEQIARLIEGEHIWFSGRLDYS